MYLFFIQYYNITNCMFKYYVLKNNFSKDRGRKEVVNWKIPIGGKTLNTPLGIVYNIDMRLPFLHAAAAHF